MMNFRKYISLSIFAFSIFCGALYTSCGKDKSKATATAVDKCIDVICNHGGTCDTGICTCPIGWGGTNCDTPAIGGTWFGSEISTHTNPPGNLNNITCTLTLSPSDSTIVLFYNYDNLGATISGILSSDKTLITFTNQDIPGVLTIISGTISLLDNSTAEFSFNETAGGLLWSNSGKYAKK